MNTLGWIQVSLLALATALNHYTPRLTRRDLYFGVTVDPGFRETAAAKGILRRYRQWNWVIGLAAMAAAALWPSPPMFFLWLILAAVGATAAYARSHRAVTPYRVQPATIRRAELLPRRSSFYERPIALAIGPALALIGLLAAFLYAPRDSAIPLFSGWAAIVGRWTRIDALVDNPLSFSLGFIVGSLLPLIVFRFGTRRGRQGVTNLRLLIMRNLLFFNWGFAAFAGVTAIAGALGYRMDRDILRWSIIVLGIGFVLHLGYLLRLGRIESLAPAAVSGPPEGDRTPDECWTWGLFYHNPNDPALLVEARCGPGYTLNFGRPIVWVLTAMFAVGISLPVLMGCFR
jgi:Family of unknown function (DUF5808)